jgi:hypothetical protein
MCHLGGVGSPSLGLGAELTSPRAFSGSTKAQSSRITRAFLGDRGLLFSWSLSRSRAGSYLFAVGLLRGGLLQGHRPPLAPKLLKLL